MPEAVASAPPYAARFSLISHLALPTVGSHAMNRPRLPPGPGNMRTIAPRSEEHTSELQSQSNLVCRLLLEKKKKIRQKHTKGEQKGQIATAVVDQCIKRTLR